MRSLKGQTIDSSSRCAFSPVTGMERKNMLLGSPHPYKELISPALHSWKLQWEFLQLFFWGRGAMRFPEYRDDAILKNWGSDTMSILSSVLAQIVSWLDGPLDVLATPTNMRSRLVPGFFMTSGQPPTPPREHELRIQVQAMVFDIWLFYSLFTMVLFPVLGSLVVTTEPAVYRTETSPMPGKK